MHAYVHVMFCTSGLRFLRRRRILRRGFSNSSLLALSLPKQAAWQTDHRARGSSSPPQHGEREPDMRSSPHPRRVVKAWVRGFRANRLPIPWAVTSPRRGCSTLANLSEESPGGDYRDGLFHCDHGQLSDAVLPVLDSARSPGDHPLECDRAPDGRMGRATIARSISGKHRQAIPDLQSRREHPRRIRQRHAAWKTAIDQESW